MRVESDLQSTVNGSPCRHPATVLWLTVLLVSYLILVRDALSSPPQGGCGTADHRSSLALFLRFVPQGEWSEVVSLFVLAMSGTALLFFVRSWLDRLFGRRPEPFYRFGLRTLLVSMAGAAVLFALAARERVEFAAGVVVALAIPIAAMGIAVWVSDRERTIRRQLAERTVSGDVLESSPSET